jgi:hypothetical protein
MEFPNKSSKRRNAVMGKSRKDKKKYKHFSLAEREEIVICTQDAEFMIEDSAIYLKFVINTEKLLTICHE